MRLPASYFREILSAWLSFRQLDWPEFQCSLLFYTVSCNGLASSATVSIKWRSIQNYIVAYYSVYVVTYGSTCNFLFTLGDCALFLFSSYLDFENSTEYCTEWHIVKIVGCRYQFVLVRLHRRRKFLKTYFIWRLAKFVANLKWLYTIPANIYNKRTHEVSDSWL